jgi:signal transduction histidine kinase
VTTRIIRSIPLVDDVRGPVRIGARLLLAAAMALAALVGTGGLEPLLGRAYFFPAFAAIVVSSILAGGRYGTATTLLFALGYAFLDLAPRGTLASKRPRELAALAAYAVTGCFVAAVGGALRQAFARLRDDHALLERTVAQREDILRALTHDVRSPLGAIRMNAAVLAREGSPDAAVGRRARAIEASVVQIDAMLQDLVKVAALESGRVVLEREPVALGPLLDHVRETLAGVLPMERVELRLPPGLPPLWADASRLERALVNLISNALKYSEGPVTIEADARGGEVTVAVRDRGAGIPREELPRLFDKYYRGSGAGERDGLGLGLYIARLLVDAHGGRLWAESTPGAGSTFFVAIPAAGDGRAPVRAAR